jgi:hypothetical protein
LSGVGGAGTSGSQAPDAVELLVAVEHPEATEPSVATALPEAVEFRSARA